MYSTVRLKDPFCVRKCHLQQRLMQDQNNNENPSIHYHFPDTEYSTCRCYSVSALLDAAGFTWMLRCKFRWFYEDMMSLSLILFFSSHSFICSNTDTKSSLGCSAVSSDDFMRTERDISVSRLLPIFLGSQCWYQKN